MKLYDDCLIYFLKKNICTDALPSTIQDDIFALKILVVIIGGFNTSLAAPGALAHRLQRRTACNAAPHASGPQNGRRGLERCLPLGFGALPSTFAK